jgi:hypothetical protein
MSYSYKEEYKTVINETRELLNANPEWRERYMSYAITISENTDFIRSARRKFALTSSLSAYINVSNAKNAKRMVNFELRHLGQSVADVIIRDDVINIDTARFETRNERDFGCGIALSNELWRSPEADKFRSFFHNRTPIRLLGSLKKNEEHRLENLLLAEFSKNTSKALPNIQPVKIAGLRFPTPTPLSASNHSKVDYANFHGGGIDILARTGKGKYAKLCIIELKDENKKTEPVSDVLKQAIKYSVFVRELLRSDAGEAWWKLFGFNSTGNNPIPENLILYTACAMPDMPEADISFANTEYNIENDVIRLHYIYFNEDGNEIKNIFTSLPYGTPKEQSQ